MVHLLNIHTATETAIITLTADSKILGTSYNYEARQHAFFLHKAIKELLQAHNFDIKQLNAVGVTSGPGSYTGIRIGLATAKGLCYALKIPLIIYNSLELLAASAITFVNDNDALYCPMIDARRMEVYTAVYNHKMEELIHPSAIILEERSFTEILDNHKIIFSGSGQGKFKLISKHAHAVFLDLEITPETIAGIASKKYVQNHFANVPYAQPLYIK